MFSSRLFYRAINQAWLALLERRSQTLLSVAGVCIGVAAVVMLSMIAESGKQKVFSEFETYGLNTIWVYRKWEEQIPGRTVRQGSGITTDNLDVIKNGCCPSVLRYSPSVYYGDWKRQIKAGNQFSKSPVQGVGEQFFSINREAFIEGRGFSEKDLQTRRLVAVIAPKTRDKLFGVGRSALGKFVRADGQRYMVIGVLAHKDRSVLDSIGATQGFDINDRMLVPYTTYQAHLGSKDIHTLLVEARHERRVVSAINEVVRSLSRLHNNRYQYLSDTMQGWIETADEILGMISIIGISGALVSLFVGGIGIFNVMSSSVKERTREIGIRKAIGARDSDIRKQFLFEALFVGILGAVSGLVLAMLFGMLMYAIYGVVLLPSLVYVFVAVFAALLIALVSGIKPAMHAAEKLPADALRYE